MELNRAYRKSMENLDRQMFKNEKLRDISVKQKNKFENKKKIAAAVYEYQVDYDGDWDICFDFEKGIHKILWRTDWDLGKSKPYAKRVIDFGLKQDNVTLQNGKLIAAEKSGHVWADDPYTWLKSIVLEIKISRRSETMLLRE